MISKPVGGASGSCQRATARNPRINKITRQIQQLLVMDR